MTRTEALRRLVLAHPPTCKSIARRHRGDDDAIADFLNDAGAMEGHLRSAANLSRDEVDSLLAPLVTGGGVAQPASPNEIETVKMVGTYG